MDQPNNRGNKAKKAKNCHIVEHIKITLVHVIYTKVQEDEKDKTNYIDK